VSSFFIPFSKSDLAGQELPERFTFPFYYEPHPLAHKAAKYLQSHLRSQTQWEHNFGIDPNKTGLVIGKMFGVMVVEDEKNQIGYLMAFSGKLAGVNNLPGFVPPIFDMLKPDGFYKKEEIEINKFTVKLKELESNLEYLAAKESCSKAEERAKQEIEKEKQLMIAARQKRRAHKREMIGVLSNEDYRILLEKQKEESLRIKYFFNKASDSWTEKLNAEKEKLAVFQNEIDKLKEIRKEMSNILQKKLFDQYHFLNIKGETIGVEKIFESTFFRVPPAGAGECAAPKLLQYAFKNKMKPICMAEFWWGASPSAEVRKSEQFYPACRGKCEPILGHMLSSMEVDENPMLQNPALGQQLTFIYEDDHMAVINKPPEFLSVPGKNIIDSVQIRMKTKFPNATGPLIVHRLDMSTSGIMLIAKSKEIHRKLQRQFIKHTIVKVYVAVLDGTVNGENGVINLPLRVDLNNRPQQMVCHEHGKQAITEWEVIHKSEGQTRIRFRPITGRTHQLRVHAAHSDGLNMAIVGDDLYGVKKDRLHLHAAYIAFTHPVTDQNIEFQVDPEF